jgi:hypothetical protein
MTEIGAMTTVRTNRRAAIKQPGGATASPAIAPRETLCPKDPDLPAGAELQAMAQIGRAFKEKFFAPGLSVAIVGDSKFVTVTTFPFEQRRVGL